MKILIHNNGIHNTLVAEWKSTLHVNAGLHLFAVCHNADPAITALLVFWCPVIFVKALSAILFIFL